MYMKVYESDFIDAFKNWETYKDNFTYEALKALFSYFEEYEEATGEDIELDVVAICCDWSEYTESNLIIDYGHIVDDETFDILNADDHEDYAEAFQALIDELEQNTTVIPVDIIVRDEKTWDYVRTDTNYLVQTY